MTRDDLERMKPMEKNPAREKPKNWAARAFYTGVVALSLIFVLLLSACAGIAP